MNKINPIGGSSKHNINYWVVYYLVLGVIQALWTNLDAFPPMPLRLAMIVGMFLPGCFRSDLVIFSMPLALILRGNLASDYQYLPDVYTYIFYIFLIVFFLVFYHRKIRLENLKYYLPLFILMVYMGLMDVFFTGEFGKYAIHIFVALLLTPFITSRKDIHTLSLSFILATVILAIHYFIMYDSFLETWSKTEDIERSGWNDPNYFSTLLDIGFMVSLMYASGYIKSEGLIILSNKLLLIIISAVIFVAVVMTASRGGFVCYVLTLLFVLLAKKDIKTLSIVGVFSGIVVFYMYNQGIFDTLIYRMFEQGNADTGGGRTTIWEEAFANFSVQPYLNQLFGGGYWHRVSLTLTGNDMHNEFVSILMDYGLVGSLIYLSYFLKTISLNKKTFMLINVPILFYILSIMSLSPFQYLYIGVLLVWIGALKKYSMVL